MSIPLSECQHGGLYRLDSRNFPLGVFNKNDNGFIGIREKFGDEYLFTEYHWDNDGTVHPLEFLEMGSIEPNEDSILLFDWLKEKENLYD